MAVTFTAVLPTASKTVPKPENFWTPKSRKSHANLAVILCISSWNRLKIQRCVLHCNIKIVERPKIVHGQAVNFQSCIVYDDDDDVQSCNFVTPIGACRIFGCTWRQIRLLSVLWRCWLDDRKDIWPAYKTDWWDVGVVVWEWDEVQTCILPSRCHCHSLSLAPVNPDWFTLPGFTFLVPAHPGSPGQIPEEQ